MNTFKIEITETFQKIIEVKAKSADEAYKTVKEKYKNEEIILNENDYIDTEIKELIYD